jgi:hypothetical protein
VALPWMLSGVLLGIFGPMVAISFIAGFVTLVMAKTLSAASGGVMSSLLVGELQLMCQVAADPAGVQSVLGVFVTREHVRHNKSGIAHQGRTRINHLRELPTKLDHFAAVGRLPSPAEPVNHRCTFGMRGFVKVSAPFRHETKQQPRRCPHADLFVLASSTQTEQHFRPCQLAEFALFSYSILVDHAQYCLPACLPLLPVCLSCLSACPTCPAACLDTRHAGIGLALHHAVVACVAGFAGPVFVGALVQRTGSFGAVSAPSLAITSRSVPHVCNMLYSRPSLPDWAFSVTRVVCPAYVITMPYLCAALLNMLCCRVLCCCPAVPCRPWPSMAACSSSLPC